MSWGPCKVSVTEHGGSWKQMYFERRLWKLVETFVPRLSHPEELVRMASLGSRFVKRLEISELMPPVVRSANESAGAGPTQKGKILLFWGKETIQRTIFQNSALIRFVWTRIHVFVPKLVKVGEGEV